MSMQGFSREGFSEVIPDCFPPCISVAIADVQANVNLSHTMRFAMTSFLLNKWQLPGKGAVREDRTPAGILQEKGMDGEQEANGAKTGIEYADLRLLHESAAVRTS